MTQIVVVSNLLPGIAQRFGAQVAKITNTAILQVVARADAQTPVDTGALRANKTITSASGSNPGGEITWNQDYAAYVEMGTYKMAAQPYAQPAVDAVTPSYLAALANLGLG